VNVEEREERETERKMQSKVSYVASLSLSGARHRPLISLRYRRLFENLVGYRSKEDDADLANPCVCFVRRFDECHLRRLNY